MLLATAAACGWGRSASRDSVPVAPILTADNQQLLNREFGALLAVIAIVMARASSLLKVAFGDSHPASQTNSFLPFATRLPFQQAAFIMQRSAGLLASLSSASSQAAA